MSAADSMRAAAAAIRRDKNLEERLGHIDARDYATWLAVASWLEACAVVLDVNHSATKAHALTVANAYLGTASARREAP